MIALPARATAFPAPRRDPLAYPGLRPAASYRLRGEAVLPWPDDLPLDLSDRVAVLAYGSNLCPGQLHHKFAPHDPTPAVPVRLGRLHGAAIVYNLISRRGYLFADLMPSPAESPVVGVTFLTPRQLAVMDATEGNYTRAVCPLRFTPALDRPLWFYAGKRRLWVPEGRPGPLHMAPAHADGVTQREALEIAIAEFGLPGSPAPSR